VKHLADYMMMTLSILLGGGSLLLFGLFVVAGPIPLLPACASERGTLLWDALLSLLFFLQHSGMVRSSFRTRLASFLPNAYHPSLYAIASGIVLIAVTLLWSESQTPMYHLEGMLRFMARALTLCAITGFWWSVRSLERFDGLGLVAIRRRIRGKSTHPPNFILRGSYLWVRHPLYFFSMVLIWSNPDVTSDRLLFNMFWSVWIVLGAYLEEKDLVAQFGDSYRQ
jgi:methanethiol S-methyltransferase